MPMLRHTSWAPTWTFIVAVLGAGCASGKSDTEKQLQSLREELTMTQNALDRAEERLVALELAKTERPSAPPAAETERSTRPALKVVKVEPDRPLLAVEAPTDAAPDSTSDGPTNPEPEAERPLIHGEGSQLRSSLDPPRAPKFNPSPAKARSPRPLRTQ